MPRPKLNTAPDMQLSAVNVTLPRWLIDSLKTDAEMASDSLSGVVRRRLSCIYSKNNPRGEK